MGEVYRRQQVTSTLELIDAQLPDWLQSIAINTEKLSSIREFSESQVAQINGEERDQKRDELERKITQLREEEVKLGRL